MGKIFAISLLLIHLSAFPCYAERIFDEKFEGAGYEESWVENVGAGCTIDEDADTADVSSPANWADQCVKVVNAGSVASYAYSQIGDGAIRYARVEAVFTDLASINDTGDRCQFAIVTNNAISAYVWNLSVYNQGGTKRIRFGAYEDGTITYYYSDNAIAEDTLYRIEVKWDSTADTWEWKINGVSQDSGSLTAGHAEMGTIVIGVIVNNHYAMTCYMDLIAIDDADWVGEEAVFIQPIINIY